MTTARRSSGSAGGQFEAGAESSAVGSLATNERATSINLIIREPTAAVKAAATKERGALKGEGRQGEIAWEESRESIECGLEADHFYDHHHHHHHHKQQHNLDYLLSSCFCRVGHYNNSNNYLYYCTHLGATEAANGWRLIALGCQQQQRVKREPGQTKRIQHGRLQEQRAQCDGPSLAGTQLRGCRPGANGPTKATKQRNARPTTVIDNTTTATKDKEQEEQCELVCSPPRPTELGTGALEGQQQAAHPSSSSSPSPPPPSLSLSFASPLPPPPPSSLAPPKTPRNRSMNSPFSCDSLRLTNKISQLKDGRDSFPSNGNKPRSCTPRSLSSLSSPAQIQTTTTTTTSSTLAESPPNRPRSEASAPNESLKRKRKRPGSASFVRLALVCLIALVAIAFDVRLVPERFLKWNGTLIAQSSAVPVNGRLAAGKLGPDSDGASTTTRLPPNHDGGHDHDDDDPPSSRRATMMTSGELATEEFSRAVLATMSTQPPVMSLGAGEPLANQSRRASLAMAQGGYRGPGRPGAGGLDELETTAAGSGVAMVDERDLDAHLIQDSEQLPPSGTLTGSGPRQANQSYTRNNDGGGASAATSSAGYGVGDGLTSLLPPPGDGQSADKLDELLGNLAVFARIFSMVAIMIGDICGNSLVILAVFRHSKLRVTTNWFVVSLACADILVALFAMTFNASVQITGRWIFPSWMCDFWNSCDVLASTASILHLCCISIDRYYAIMRPLDYPMKITTRRVCYALAVVWISSALLSYIPIFTGIYTTSEHSVWRQANPDQCEFVVNRVYAIVSSSISFWIPACIMIFTYWRIYEEATRQEKFIYKAQNMLPAPQSNHANSRAKQHRSKSMAVTSLTTATANTTTGPDDNKGTAGGSADQANKIKQLAKQTIDELKPEETGANSSQLLVSSNSATTPAGVAEQQPLTGSAINLNNNNNNNNIQNQGKSAALSSKTSKQKQKKQQQQQQQQDDQDDRDSNSGQSTPTKRSISKMKREHKAAKTLGIIMGVFILCWLPFFSWYTPVHICGHVCDGMVPKNVVTLLFWIGYFNSTLNPIIYAYFNHEFRDAFKKTLQWIFCCCRDLKCLRVNRSNDNQHYNCTYRSTQEIGLVTNG